MYKSALFNNVVRIVGTLFIILFPLAWLVHDVTQIYYADQTPRHRSLNFWAELIQVLGKISLLFVAFYWIRKSLMVGGVVLWFQIYLFAIYCGLLIFQFANAYKHLGIKSGNSIVFDGPSAIYFSIVTWTTLGYGDLSPSNDARMLAALEAMLGYIAMAILMGLVIHIMTRRTP